MDFCITNIAETVSPNEVEISFTTSGGEPAEKLLNLDFQIMEIRPLRDNLVMTIGIGGLLAHGNTNKFKATGLNEGLYAITHIISQNNLNEDKEYHSISGNTCFNIPLSQPIEKAKDEVSRIHSERKSLATRELIVENADSNSELFTAIIYYSGVKLHDPFLLLGAEVYPLEGSLGVEGIETPLIADLERIFPNKIQFPDSVRTEFQQANQIFAVRLFRMRAKTIEKACDFSQEFAEKIVTIISLERGEKAQYCATFIAYNDTYRFFPAYNRYRGNYLAPMFSSEHPDRIEKYQPVMEKSEYANLLVTLLAEAIGDRKFAFRHFRCWALLEQIAKKYITSDTINLQHPDGSPVMGVNRNGQPFPKNSRGAHGKVFQYLKQNNWPAFDLEKRTHDGRIVRIEGTDIRSHDPNREMISLWDAVGAMYNIRNRVAHKGHAQNSTPPTNEELLADQIARDGAFQNGFLYNLTSTAVWREVEQER